VHGLAVDSAGDAYITGTIASNDLPIVSAFQSTFSGQVSTSTRNAFVQKLDSTGSQLFYSTYLGGGSDVGTAIAVDNSGSAYVVGRSGGTIPTKNPLQLDTGTFFITKFSPQGSSLVYSTLLGTGGQSDQPNSVAVDGQGNAYISGSVTTLDYPFTLNAFKTACLYTFTIAPSSAIACSGPEAIVMKMNSSGSALSYSTLLGDGSANAIAVDTSGNVYVAGNAMSNYFPQGTPIEVGQSSFPNNVGGAFVTKLNTSGTPTFSTLLSGMSDSETALSIAVDGSHNIIVGGSTGSGNFPIVNPLQSTTGPGFIAKISPSNNPGIAVSLLQPLVHVRNVSTVAIDITNISVSSTVPGVTFTAGGNCGNSVTLAPGTECFLVVVQTSPPPSVAANVVVTSNAAASPQTFTIQPSTAVTPQWVYSPGSLRFAPQYVGTTSAAQAITITNLALQPLTVDSIQASAPDFLIDDGCTGTLAAGASCSFSVAFSPTSTTAVGQLTISYSAPFITGTGNPPTVQDLVWVFGQPTTSSIFPSIQSLTFGSQYAGLPGNPRLVTLINSTPASVPLGTISVSGPYSFSSNCNSALSAQGSCRILVTFAPTSNGFASGSLLIPFSGSGSPASISLSGTGKLFSDLAISPLSLDFGPAVIGGLETAERLRSQT